MAVETGELQPGERVVARVDHAARHATEANHTATHLLHAALRRRLGTHVRQAGSYVGPDKLRFDFSHSQAMTAEELRDVEDQVNAWILRNDPVRPLSTTLEEARRLGAMALFGEKYGDVVRMVEIGDGEYSRELCGGTHVSSTAEIGLLRITGETSSAANVRRIEAVTGPVAVDLLRRHDDLLKQAASLVRTSPEGIWWRHWTRASASASELERRLKRGHVRVRSAVDPAALAGDAVEVAGAQVLTAVVDAPDAKALLEIVDRVKGRLDDAAIVLGTVVDGRVHLVASVAPSLVERGVKAGAIVKAAAELTGGGGGGRDTMAQAGGRDPEQAARGDCRRPLGHRRGARRLSSGAVRVLALDYGSARCGCAVSDPTATIVTPIDPVLRPASRRGMAALAALVADRRRGSRGRGPAPVAVGVRHGADARDARIRRAAGPPPGSFRGARALRRAFHHPHGPAAGQRRRLRGLTRGGSPLGGLAGRACGQVREPAVDAGSR